MLPMSAIYTPLEKYSKPVKQRQSILIEKKQKQIVQIVILSLQKEAPCKSFDCLMTTKKSHFHISGTTCLEREFLCSIAQNVIIQFQKEQLGTSFNHLMVTNRITLPHFHRQIFRKNKSNRYYIDMYADRQTQTLTHLQKPQWPQRPNNFKFVMLCDIPSKAKSSLG